MTKTLSNDIVITIPTSLGNAEARKSKQREPWDICYPWGADRFYGTADQVKRRMEAAIAKHDTEATDP